MQRFLSLNLLLLTSMAACKREREPASAAKETAIIQTPPAAQKIAQPFFEDAPTESPQASAGSYLVDPEDARLIAEIHACDTPLAELRKQREEMEPMIKECRMILSLGSEESATEIPAEIDKLFQKFHDLESEISELEDRRVRLVKEAEERRRRMRE